MPALLKAGGSLPHASRSKRTTLVQQRLSLLVNPDSLAVAGKRSNHEYTSGKGTAALPERTNP